MTAKKLFDLTGKVALVTGASRGIGLASARALGTQGARVYLNSRNAAELEAVCSQLALEDIEALACPFDAFDGAAAEKAMDDILRREGRLDILFLNAAIQARAPLLDFDANDFVRLIQGNLISQWEFGRQAAKRMLAQASGRIIFTGSILSLMGRENVTGYTASKAAIHGIVRQWSTELAPKGITVNAVAPGYVKTQLTSALHEDPKFCHWLETRTPIGRWAQPEDIAGAVVYLASN